MEQVKYVFIKEFKTQDGNIPQGTEIRLWQIMYGLQQTCTLTIKIFYITKRKE